MVSIGCKSGNSWIEWIGRKLGKPPATAKTQWLAGVRAMIGMGQSMWRGEDPDEYVRKLRDGWD
jgi:hypothetical protein